MKSSVIVSVLLLASWGRAEDCNGPVMASTKLPDQCPVINYVVDYNLTDYLGFFYIQFTTLDYPSMGCDGTCVTETVELTPDGGLDIAVYCKHETNCQKVVGGGLFALDPDVPGLLNGPDDTHFYLLGYADNFFIWYACVPGCPRTDLLYVKTREANIDSATTQKIIKILAENGFDIAEVNNVVNYDNCPPIY